MPDTSPERDKPRVKIVPPKVASLFLAIGIMMNWIVPLHPFDFWTSFFGGLFLVTAGGILIGWAVNIFSEKGTNIRIDRPVTCVVTSGPYAITRNPIYLGGAILYAGIALLFDSGWALLLLIPLIAIIQKRVILPEEEYLEAKFGRPYLDYKAKVKRWL
jgi:protein-S-isoprenylcysteine O-methyltransferase Ste14